MPKVLPQFFLLFAANVLLLSANTYADDADLPIVAVAQFKSTVDQDRRWYDDSSKPANFEVMVETQLMKIGRFKVFERNRVDQILGEQALQENFSSNGTKLQLAGVDYLIYGSITSNSSEVKKIQTGNFSSTKLVTKFGVDVKIVDALSGEIRRAEAVKVVYESGNAIGTGNFSQAELSGDGLVEAQRKAAKMVGSLLIESIFPITVVDVSGNDVYLNYGDAILSVGDRLKVVKPGRKLVDPQSGKVLGSTESTLGQVVVTETTDQFSIASVAEGEIPGPGDLARIVTNGEGNTSNNTQRKRFGRKI